MGEIVKAVVVPEEGSGLEIKELRRFCIERLASYQVPQKIELRAELPRTPSGKVIKRLLVEE
jgi:acyl-CoA synthetase (AMP-forming)/AMP-acid ligase II